MAGLTVTGETLSDECGLCLAEGQHTEANHFCQDCDSYICVSCKDSHTKFKDLRNHTLLSGEKMPRNCGLCRSEGKTTGASYYCVNCNSHICDSCQSSHNKFKDLRKHSVLSGTNMKPSRNISEIKDKYDNPSESTIKSMSSESFITPSADSSKPTETSADEPSSSPSNPDNGSDSNGKNNVLFDKKMSVCKQINIRVQDDAHTPRITGCTFMPTGQLVIADTANRRIKLLNSSFQIQSFLNLKYKPLDISAVDDSKVVVSYPVKKRLQIVQVLPSFQDHSTISVDKKCRSVTVVSDCVFVSCCTITENEDGEIQMYDLKGNLIKRVGVKLNFIRPEYFAESKEKMFVIDNATATLTCFTFDGKIVYQYRDDFLSWSRGLYVDAEDNAFICDKNGNKIRVVTARGERNKALLTYKDRISNPCSISYREFDGTLAVGCDFNDKMLLYSISSF